MEKGKNSIYYLCRACGEQWITIDDTGAGYGYCPGCGNVIDVTDIDVGEMEGRDNEQTD